MLIVGYRRRVPVAIQGDEDDLVDPFHDEGFSAMVLGDMLVVDGKEFPIERSGETLVVRFDLVPPDGV